MHNVCSIKANNKALNQALVIYIKLTLVIYIHKHLVESGHANFDWTNFKVLGRSNENDSRLFLESSFTYVNDNHINGCVDMPNQYKLAISSILRKFQIHLIFFFLNLGCFLNT